MRKAFLFTILAFTLVTLSMYLSLKINNKTNYENNPNSTNNITNDILLENDNKISDFNMQINDGTQLIVGKTMSIDSIGKSAAVVNVSINKVKGNDDLSEYIFSVDKNTVLVDKNLNKITLFNQLKVEDELGFLYYIDDSKFPNSVRKVMEEAMQEDIEESNKTYSTKAFTNKVNYALVAVYGGKEEGYFINLNSIKDVIFEDNDAEEIMIITTNDNDIIQVKTKNAYSYNNGNVGKLNTEDIIKDPENKLILTKYTLPYDENEKVHLVDKILLIDAKTENEENNEE